MAQPDFFFLISLVFVLFAAFSCRRPGTVDLVASLLRLSAPRQLQLRLIALTRTSGQRSDQKSSSRGESPRYFNCVDLRAPLHLSHFVFLVVPSFLSAPLQLKCSAAVVCVVVKSCVRSSWQASFAFVICSCEIGESLLLLPDWQLGGMCNDCCFLPCLLRLGILAGC